MELQTGAPQQPLTDTSIQTRQWITFVRDPIDHFLSGWAECGHLNGVLLHRNKNAMKRKGLPLPGDPPNVSYDTRIQIWLERLQSQHEKEYVHSLPQANFLISSSSSKNSGAGEKRKQGAAGGVLVVYPNLVLVADLTEMPSVLEHVLGLPYDASLGKGRASSQDNYKAKNFPRRPDLLSNETVRKICDFVKIDYFLFDFEPPAVCGDLIQLNTDDPTGGWL